LFYAEFDSEKLLNIYKLSPFKLTIFALYNNVIKEIQLEVNKGAMLPLMEEFYTIQGEGYHTGTAAYFIRIGGCDVGHWCDVKESWNAELHPPTGIDSNSSKCE
jgi:hypothetical protein